MNRCVYLLILFFPLVLGGFPKIPPTVGRPWPLPQSELQANDSSTIDISTFQFVATGNDCEILQNAFLRYQGILSTTLERTSFRKNIDPSSNVVTFANPLTSLGVNVITPCEAYPHLYMDEQYELKICAPGTPDEATLVSQSIWGALRGLETFSQILVPVGPTTFEMNCTQILDFPRFSHRGVMLDTARHYIPVGTILENLDLMAMNKLNVFHWHMVDDQSFPYESAVYPDLSVQGAWSPIHVYTQENMSTVVEYAKNLGIRVLVEFDTPGHTLSWGVGQPGLLTPCYTLGIPDGTFGPIDPSNEANFVFLQNLFSEIASRFPDHYLHLGGDEVDFSCWQSNPAISDFMNSLNITGDYEKLEEYYITRLLNIVSNLSTANGYLVWEEVFDNNVVIAPDTVVHIWKYEDNPLLYFPELASVTAAGYQALLSSCWYLNYISYGVDWHKYYDCDPQGFNGTAQQKQLVLGGEACMWAEYVDETNLISRTWPRAAPVAERLWSDAAATQDHNEAAPRLEEHRCRLLTRGYGVQPFGPSFCEGFL